MMMKGGDAVTDFSSSSSAVIPLPNHPDFILGLDQWCLPVLPQNPFQQESGIKESKKQV